MKILSVAVRTYLFIARIKACAARRAVYGCKREAKLCRFLDSLSHTHSVLVSFAFDFSVLVMYTIQKQRDLRIAYHVFYFAAIYVEIEKLCFNDISCPFGTLTFAAGKLRSIFAVNSHSEQRYYLITEVF